LASPDGRILLTQGFLNAYYQGQVTAEEIAGVVAHELGHVALNHSGRRTISFGIQSTIRYTFGILVSRFIPFIGNQVMELVLRTLNAKLSRVDEYAADKYAAALLTKTGIGTEPLITLFEKLDKLSGTQNQGIAWLASHPNSKDRIKQINQLVKDWNQ
jgi:putative metalloprotease